MAKVKTSVQFKQYCQQQNLLLPSSLDELIGPHHLVRVVNEVVEAMDISGLISQYQGGGTTAYHPRMLLKVLLYAYSVKIYTGRKIAQALSQDIHFMWLSAMNRPDFRTINHFRSSKAKQVIEELFKELLEFLMEHSYIRMENYFCDGSTLRADANEHKMVWRKNAVRYKESASQKCQQLFKQIDELNREENREYGNSNLEENGKDGAITKEAISRQIDRLNEKLKTATDNKTIRKAGSITRKLREAESKIDKYEHQLRTSGDRSGYNKTDVDASSMMMKNKVEILPAYNILAGSEQQFITGISVHQNGNDGACFKDHLEQIAVQQPFTTDRIIADSIFGTEQNYELLEGKQIENYLKFPAYHAEQKRDYSKKIFLKENFSYDPLTDSYQCPNKKQLLFKKQYEQTNKRDYTSLIRQYECEDCTGCPFYQQCCKSPDGGNRTIQINEKLNTYKQQARENLGTEKGMLLKKQRSIEIESCFGDIKQNMGFRRFHLRGLQKVKTEITIVAMAHNIRKICLNRLQKAA